MKKYTITALLITALSLSVLAFSCIYIGGMQDDVTYKEEVLYGDKAYADGAEIISRTMAESNALNWETAYAVGDTIESESKFQYNLPVEKMSPETAMWELFSLTPSYGGTQKPETVMPLSEYKPFYNMCAQTASKCKAGQDYEETLKLADYCNYFPLNFGPAGYSYNDKGADYFQLHVPKDTEANIRIQKNEKDRVYGWQIAFDTEVKQVSYFSDKGCYIALSSIERTPFDEKNAYCKYAVPKGISGIHFIPYMAGSESHEDLDFEHGKMLYPLTEKEQPVYIHQSADGKTLFLITKEKQNIYLSVIDTASMKLKQKLFLRNFNSDEYISMDRVLEKDNALLISFSDQTFALIAEKDGKYSLQFTDTFKDTPETEDAYYKAKYYVGTTFSADMDYDGKRMILLLNNTHYDKNRSDFYNLILVYTKDGVQYIGKYTPSTVRKNDDNGIREPYRKISPVAVTLPK